jgi:hypothetical protein
VLDHQHLLSGGFGASPQKLGKLWPRVKSEWADEHCPDMTERKNGHAWHLAHGGLSCSGLASMLKPPWSGHRRLTENGFLSTRMMTAPSLSSSIQVRPPAVTDSRSRFICNGIWYCWMRTIVPCPIHTSFVIGLR